MHKMFYWFIFLFLALIVTIWYEWPDDQSRVVVCDVGQGDAILVYQRFTQVLIDTGNDSNRVLTCLSHHLPFWDRHLEVVVITHPDADHMGALSPVLQRFKTSVIMASGIANDTLEFAEIYQYISKSNIKVHTAQQGQRITLGNMAWKILWPEKSSMSNLWENKYIKRDQNKSEDLSSYLSGFTVKDPNRASVVMQLEVEGVSLLLTGDISEVEELALIRNNLIEDIEVLKVAHHGSKTSSSKVFLEATKPELSLIGVGKDNNFGHPNQSVVDRLISSGSEVYRTDLDGEIILRLSKGKVILE